MADDKPIRVSKNEVDKIINLPDRKIAYNIDPAPGDSKTVISARWAHSMDTEVIFEYTPGTDREAQEQLAEHVNYVYRFLSGQHHAEMGRPRNYLITSFAWHRGYTKGRLEFYRAKWNRQREEGAKYAEVPPHREGPDLRTGPADHPGEEA